MADRKNEIMEPELKKINEEGIIHRGIAYLIIHTIMLKNLKLVIHRLKEELKLIPVQIIENE